MLKFCEEYLRLYGVTDQRWSVDKSLEQQVEDAIKAGATMIQYREKQLPYQECLKIAESLKKITERYNIPFIINDHVKIALKLDADGVHVGQSDMDGGLVRQLIGNHKILGITAKTMEQAKKAERDGADYIGCGDLFGTSTKKGALPVSVGLLKDICSCVTIPVVGIGGINASNIYRLKGSGIAGVAVVSAIFSMEDIENATKNLLQEIKEMKEVNV